MTQDLSLFAMTVDLELCASRYIHLHGPPYVVAPYHYAFSLKLCHFSVLFSGCPGDFQVLTGDGPLPMAIFELLEYIVNEVKQESRSLLSLPVCCL